MDPAVEASELISPAERPMLLPLPVFDWPFSANIDPALPPLAALV